MEQTEYILTPILLGGKDFADLKSQVVALRMANSSMSVEVTYLTETTAIAEIYQSYQITRRVEGKTNG